MRWSPDRVCGRSGRKDLAEPEKRRLAIFARDLVHGSAVAGFHFAAQQAGRSVQRGFFLRAEPASKSDQSPLFVIVSCSSRRSKYSSCPARELVMVGVERRDSSALQSARRSLTFCWTWDGSRDVSPSRASAIDAAERELHLLDLCVELAELRWQIETFLDEQVLDRVLDRPLALGEERLEVVGRERVAEQDVERGRRDEVRLEDGTYRRSRRSLRSAPAGTRSGGGC